MGTTAKTLSALALGCGLGLTLTAPAHAGTPAAASVAQQAPAVDGDKDCADFPDQPSAQAFYEANGGPAADPHRLDRDQDGLACEAYFGVDEAAADRSTATTINSGIPAGTSLTGLAGGTLLVAAGVGVGLRARRQS